MKTSIFTVILAAATTQFAIAQSCDCETLSGALSVNKTLTTGNCYELECFSVPGGKTLTIQPGVVIFANSGASLYVERGGVINAAGTSTQPIVFTSAQAATSRAAGDWGEIVIAGEATNNVSGGEISLDRGCGFEGGGNDDNDNSGVFRYVQIHYATNGLTLLSVGDGTEINNIQVTNAANDGFQFYGGTVNAKKLFSYNTHRNDLFFTDGNRSLLQEVVGFRQDPSAHVAAGSYGASFQNDNSGSSNTPLTAPTISNLQLIGPSYCTGSGLSANFLDGIDIRRNASPKIYNAVEANWPQYGMRITDVGTVTNTANDILNFSYNTLTNNGSGYYTTATSWSTGCDASMTDWIEPSSLFPPSCVEAGNQFVSMTLGYNNSSMCTSTTNPDFTLGTSSPTMDAPDYTAADLSPAFFDELAYRGAFGSTDWTNGWTEWDAQNVEYCDEERMGRSNNENGQLRLSPNPAAGRTIAYFETNTDGIVTVSVASALDGKVMIHLPKEQMIAGAHEVTIHTSGLRTGVYIVRVVAGDQVLQQHLLVQ